jgi:tetratricopeptide (TPR) repeat protein
VSIDAKLTAAYMNRGVAYLGKSEWDLAIADFTMAIKLNPGQYAAYFNRGQAFGAKRERDRAISDFDQAIRQIDPTAR